jgi:hypothetical protein
MKTQSTYDKRYVSDGVYQRLQVLHDRYYLYCNGQNENGTELTPGGAAVGRSKCKTDMDILMFVDELIGNIPHDFVLSEEAAKGYEKLCEPYERHRINWSKDWNEDWNEDIP